MANPALLLLDTDALIQLIIGKSLKILRALKVQYGIQPVIVPEVENELLVSRKFALRIKSDLTKAIQNGVIKVLDSGMYAALTHANPILQAAAVGFSYADIQLLGGTYRGRVGPGEAYSFATAVKLLQPACSNDKRAVDTLNGLGHSLPPTVLRAFDLVVFAFQTGILTAAECDSFRQIIAAEPHEAMPKEFRSASFANGLPSFVPRLVDSSKATCGATHPPGSPSWTTPLLIVP